MNDTSVQNEKLELIVAKVKSVSAATEVTPVRDDSCSEAYFTVNLGCWDGSAGETVDLRLIFGGERRQPLGVAERDRSTQVRFRRFFMTAAVKLLSAPLPPYQD